jgi:putative PIN family toxin of toxin-antitoxin system
LKLRVVFDVNVWINALLGPHTDYPYLPVVPPKGLNPSADAMSMAFDGDRFAVYCSPHILRNIARVLHEAGLSEFTVSRALQDVADIVALSGGSIVEPKREVVHQRDHEDNLILDLVLETDAAILVTADSELLDANGWKGRAILHPKPFVDLALSINLA